MGLAEITLMRVEIYAFQGGSRLRDLHRDEPGRDNPDEGRDLRHLHLRACLASDRLETCNYVELQELPLQDMHDRRTPPSSPSPCGRVSRC